MSLSLHRRHQPSGLLATAGGLVAWPVLAGGAALAAFCLVTWLAWQASAESAALAVVPLALAGGAAAAALLAYAAAGGRSANLVFLSGLIFINDALFRVREAGDLGLDWQNAMKMALWCAAAGIGLAQLATRGVRQPIGVTLALAYGGFAIASAVYSEAPAYSAATAFGMVGLLLYGLALPSLLSERQIMLAAIWSLCLFILAGWIVYAAVPELGRSPFMTADGSIVERLCGIAGQANALGRVVAVFLGLLFLSWHRGHASLALVLPLALLGIVTLLVADSRASLVGLAVGMAAVLTRRSLWLWGASILAVLVAALALLAVPLRVLLGFTADLGRSGDPTELLTLTGRTDIWAFSWDKILLSPWLGYGYNSSKFILPQFVGLGIEIDEAHNMLLQNLLSVGVIGTLPLLLLVVYFLVAYVRRPNPVRDFFFFFIMVYGVTEAGAFGSTPSILTLFLFVGMALPDEAPAVLARHPPGPARASMRLA